MSIDWTRAAALVKRHVYLPKDSVMGLAAGCTCEQWMESETFALGSWDDHLAHEYAELTPTFPLPEEPAL